MRPRETIVTPYTVAPIRTPTPDSWADNDKDDRHRQFITQAPLGLHNGSDPYAIILAERGAPYAAVPLVMSRACPCLPRTGCHSTPDRSPLIKMPARPRAATRIPTTASTALASLSSANTTTAVVISPTPMKNTSTLTHTMTGCRLMSRAYARSPVLSDTASSLTTGCTP